MPRLVHRTPQYRRHRVSGQAVVTLDGQDIYLGSHGTKASRDEYDRVIGEWLANGRRLANNAQSDRTVFEVLQAFWTWAQTYYVMPVQNADGSPVLTTTGAPASQPAGELDNYRMAIRPLKRLYGPTCAAAFGPLALQSVMAEMVKLGWCRNVVNRQAGRVKAVFKWAVAQELIPPSVHQGLLAVSGLRKGKAAARESDPVKPVPEADVAKVLTHVSKQVRAMIELQLVTGMRPGEVVSMRQRDLDTTGPLWVYRPASHKTAHHGHARVIYLGPRAQQILQPYVKPDPAAFLFSPAESEAERHRRQGEERKSDVSPSQADRARRARRRIRRRAPGKCYDVGAYRRAIARGCEAAFGMPAELKACPGDTLERKKEKASQRAAWREQHAWHPHQLRHNAATRLRKDYGLEAAQVILGHKTLAVTEIYAEKNVAAARKVMAEVG